MEVRRLKGLVCGGVDVVENDQDSETERPRTVTVWRNDFKPHANPNLEFDHTQLRRGDTIRLGEVGASTTLLRSDNANHSRQILGPIQRAGAGCNDERAARNPEKTEICGIPWPD